MRVLYSLDLNSISVRTYTHTQFFVSLSFVFSLLNRSRTGLKTALELLLFFLLKLAVRFTREFFTFAPYFAPVFFCFSWKFHVSLTFCLHGRKPDEYCVYEVSINCIFLLLFRSHFRIDCLLCLQFALANCCSACARVFVWAWACDLMQRVLSIFQQIGHFFLSALKPPQ